MSHYKEHAGCETRTLQPKRTPKSGCPTILNVVFKELNPV